MRQGCGILQGLSASHHPFCPVGTPAVQAEPKLRYILARHLAEPPYPTINVGAGCAPAALAPKRFNLPRRADTGVPGGAEHGTRGYVGDTLGTMRSPCRIVPSPTLSYPLLPVFRIISCMCACPYHESVLWTILPNAITALLYYVLPSAPPASPCGPTERVVVTNQEHLARCTRWTLQPRGVRWRSGCCIVPLVGSTSGCLLG